MNRLHGRIGRSSVARRGRGFTLIEVITSLAIIAVVMPPLLYGLNMESEAASLARNRTQAASLARQKIDEIVANYSVAGLADSGGNFDDPWQKFSWTADLELYPTQVDVSGTTFLQQLDVTVTWKQGGQSRDLMLSTIIYQKQAPGTIGTAAPASGVSTGGLAK